MSEAVWAFARDLLEKKSQRKAIVEEKLEALEAETKPLEDEHEKLLAEIEELTEMIP